MENIELFRMLEIPKEVEKQLINYGRRRNLYIPNIIINKILKRDEWNVGIKELQELLDDDSDELKFFGNY